MRKNYCSMTDRGYYDCTQLIRWLNLILIIVGSLACLFTPVSSFELELDDGYFEDEVASPNTLLRFCEDCHIYLGGLFPVHAPKYVKRVKTGPVNLSEFALESSASASSETEIPNSKECGEIKKERGIQRLEAMLYAIDLINNMTDLLPDTMLGAKIHDTCDRDTIALEKSISFVSDHFLLNSDDIVNDFICEPTNPEYLLTKKSQVARYTPKKLRKNILKRKVMGVIGAASSSVSVQVANLLRLFKVPQISYSSSSPELSNKERFPYFSRVLPSDTLQAKAMADLVYSMEWNYITTISEEGNAGGIDTFISNVKNRKICISESYTLSQTSSEQHVRNMLMEIYENSNARAVVMFMQDHNIRKLLGIVSELNLTDHFLWVASDGWGTKREPINSNDKAAEGAITFSPKFYRVQEFNDYFENLKPKLNKRNPWFREFWEEQFNCTLARSATAVRLSKRQCTGEERLNVTQDGFIHFVIDSVYAMAHGIHNLLEYHCGLLRQNRTLLSDCRRSIELQGSELLDSIRNVEFTSITGRKVKFIKNKKNSGDGLAPFEVFQYQRTPQGNFKYVKIAEWESDRDFTIQKSNLRWGDGTSNIPRSFCKEECKNGEVKQGDDCCWVCVKCDETQYVSEDRKSCIKCSNGDGPNENKTGCEKLPIEYMQLNTAFTLVPLIFSSFGLLLTSFTIGVFIRYSETPIIKASGRELCYVLLSGIMSCYMITFPLVLKPTFVSCLILRFGVSLSLTICLSALFTKTFRLSRIFNKSVKSSLKASCVSPNSQLVICFSIISVQILGLILWVVIVPPGTDYDYGDPKRVILQCKTQNLNLVISCLYSFFLAILCTVYAVKTRKIPSNFNEARFIGFTMYSICIIWIAFVPIYFGTTAAAGTKASPKNNYKIQLTTLAMCLSLSATVILSCLFLPKLRVVLLKPDKNVRSKSKVTMSRNNTSANTSTIRYSSTNPKDKEMSVNSQRVKLEPARESFNLTPGVSVVSTEVKKKTPSETDKSLLTSQQSIKSKSSNRNSLVIKAPTDRPIIEPANLLNEKLDATNSTCSIQTTCNSLNKSGTNENDPLLQDLNVSEFSKFSTFTSRVEGTAKDSRVSFMDFQKNKNQSQIEEEMKQLVNNSSSDKQQNLNSRAASRVNEQDIMVFRRSRNSDRSRDSSPESYEYLVTLRKVSSRNPSDLNAKNGNGNRFSAQLNSTGLNDTIQSSSSLRSMSEINVDEEFFNESTIKEVVEQCFEELSKNKRLSNTHVCLKGKNINKIKETVIINDSSKIHNPLMSSSKRSDFLNINIDSGDIMTTTSDETGSADDDSADTLSADGLQIPMDTYVERLADKSGSSLPTNTILVTNDSKGTTGYGSGGTPRTQTSHNSNDLYSLKITFV